MTARHISSELYVVRTSARSGDASQPGETTSNERGGLVLSLFTGAGGLDLGLEAAGYQTVAYVENNEDCLATLEFNRPSWKRLEPLDAVIAARKLRSRDIGLEPGEVDILAAGPPCQPFSSAAQWLPSGRRGMEDDRAETVRATVGFVRVFQPKVLLIENVIGFVRADDGAMRVLRAGLQRINRDLGTEYDLHHVVLDAADYGVPQHRRRAIVVASRDGKNLVPPPPTHVDRPMRAWDAIGDLPDPGSDVLPLGTWASDLLPSIPEGGNYQWLTAKGGGDEVFGYRTRYWSFLLKLAKDRPSWTLSASGGPSTGPFHWDNRQLTVRERLRLQSFPDDWKLSGSVRSQVRMAGNATPPLLAEIIGRAIAQQILHPGTTLDQRTSLSLPRKRTVPAAVDPVPVPKRLRCLIGKKEAHPGAGFGPSPRHLG